MICRSRVLDPKEVPDQELIVHRGGHLQDVRVAFQRMAAAEKPSPFMLTGPPGTGKTLIARNALRQVAQQEDIRTAYIDCWTDYDDYHLLTEVVDRLNLGVVHKNSTARGTLVNALHQPADKARFIILDELEMVHEAKPIQELADAPSLSVACIVNDPDEIADSLSDVWDGVPKGSQRLEFRHYSVSELVEILSKRAAHGLSGDPVTERRLEQMAEAAAGDARLGICILREAARHAREAGVAQIGETHLSQGVETARRKLYQATLERLTTHQQVLYNIVVSQGPLSPGELRKRYRERIDDPRSRQTVNTYLDKMEHYDLITVTGRTQARSCQVDTSGYAPPERIC